MNSIDINDGYYTLFEDGRVYSNHSKKFIALDHSNKCGYVRVTLYLPFRTRHLLHRLVAEYFLEKPTGSMEALVVNHIDGNKKNNHFSNLEWVTKSENEKHAFRSGLRPKAIRPCVAMGKRFTSVAIAADTLGLSYNTVYNRCLSKNHSNFYLLDRE